MENNRKQIEILLKRLEELQSRQTLLQWDINLLETNIRQLQTRPAEEEAPTIEQPTEAVKSIFEAPVVEEKATPEAPAPISPTPPITEEVFSAPKPAFDLERFIGENVSNKVGAFITVLGVGIGVKYAIDNNLIGPLGRILLGYAIALGMLVFSYRFRPLYKDLSTVLLSGAVCIAYFTTYAAYDYYHLISLPVAFFMLLAITGYTIGEAMLLDRQIIAIGGMVGAYWIPSVLGGQAGTAVVTLSYIALINLGILYISFRKQWEIMHYLAFAISWGNMMALGTANYQREMEIFTLNIVYFSTFIGMYSVRRWLQNAPHTIIDSAYLILNGFAFTVTGVNSLSWYVAGHENITPKIFLYANSLFYFVSGYLLFRRFGQERPFSLVSRGAVFYLLMAAFLHLDDAFEWMVFLSAVMVLCFGVGRRYRLRVYEQIILPLFLLGTVVLIALYSEGYAAYLRDQGARQFPVLLNRYSMAFAAFSTALLAIYQILIRVRAEPEAQNHSIESLIPNINQLVLIALGCLLFFYGLGELSHYYDQQFRATYFDGRYFEDILSFKAVSILNYTMLFSMVLNILAIRTQAGRTAREGLATLSFLSILVFLMMGLYTLGHLKNCYFNPPDTLFTPTGWHLGMRYLSISILGMLCISLWKIIRRPNAPRLVELDVMLPLFLHGVALWVVSSELVHWMEINGMGSRSYKVVLSILFGCWSVMLIVLGIRQNHQAFRVAAIVLFGVTLFKLFLYDLSQLSTIAKTIVLISLGVLLLLISYLYNRFKEKFL